MTSSGSGNLSHLSGELFKMMIGIDMMHVPYRGPVLPHTGLMAGEVHVMFDALLSALPQIQAGKLRALEGAAGHPNRWRVRPGLHGERFAWYWRSERHACRNRWQAQQGNQCGY